MAAKIGFLTSLGSIVTVPYLEGLESHDLKASAIFIDGSLPEKSMQIIRERLGNTFKNRDLMDISSDIPCYFVQNHNSENSIKLYRALGLDYLVNAGTPRILKEDTLRSTKGVINCHPGILPLYRGCSAVEWSIYNNDPVGATAHFMNSKIDEGPIIYFEKLNVEIGEVYSQIRQKMISHQAEVLATALSIAVKDNLLPETMAPQEQGKYYKPIPDELLAEVKRKLELGQYLSK